MNQDQIVSYFKELRYFTPRALTHPMYGKLVFFLGYVNDSGMVRYRRPCFQEEQVCVIEEFIRDFRFYGRPEPEELTC